MSKNVANDRADFFHARNTVTLCHCASGGSAIWATTTVSVWGGRGRKRAGQSAHVFLGMHIVTFATVFGLCLPSLPLPREPSEMNVQTSLPLIGAVSHTRHALPARPPRHAGGQGRRWAASLRGYQ